MAFQQPVNRIQPQGQVQDYKTYGMVVPPTHWRKATCAEVGCKSYANGWRTRVEDLDAEQLHLAKNCGRKYTVLSIQEGETWLLYEAGQPCFAASTHQVRLDKPELFLVRGGDWRGTVGEVQRRTPDDWVDDFATHQDKIARQIERG